MKALLISLRYLVIMTVILGGIYPLLVMFVGQNLFPAKSRGSLIIKGNRIVGSELLAQKFVREDFFWPRPSSTDYATLGAGGSNQSGTSKKLKEAYIIRKKNWGEEAPRDLLYASASGLDPHISLESAHAQKVRVMARRNLDSKKMDELIRDATEEKFLGFMGQARVNVLKLNMSLP